MRSTRSDYLETSTQYEDVIDSLKISAHVFADGYIGLETDVLLGSKNTPEGVKQIPIITKKEIQNKQNRIRQGESLVIGGIRKNEEYAVVRGVPILKDIPLIGFLFSSEDTENRAVETIFILTPTISTDGRPTEEVMKNIQTIHEPESL
jgi:type II secretory pathway component GspD/PulD (secretin)